MPGSSGLQWLPVGTSDRKPRHGVTHERGRFPKFDSGNAFRNSDESMRNTGAVNHSWSSHTQSRLLIPPETCTSSTPTKHCQHNKPTLAQGHCQRHVRWNRALIPRIQGRNQSQLCTQAAHAHLLPASSNWGIFGFLSVAGAIGLWSQDNTRIGRELSG